MRLQACGRFRTVRYCCWSAGGRTWRRGTGRCAEGRGWRRLGDVCGKGFEGSKLRALFHTALALWLALIVHSSMVIASWLAKFSGR